ncbi:MAG TPA: tRNA (adenosine(37)-N6)-dimethylallyltransferase MiaA [Bacteroidales bacterium]|nr:MAG: tRNA (adenosine(37)-N6)-dimethylallyltransferase MiaA [Bacteroidetes bacterium GWF2_33_38]OFY68193.1 MAG: tRNA (adenosine(37)-N6)-dimethylallyltransferase MiaA [Bacteroidetes bacterium RIFOXYA12_FULL_33_9]HBF87498.1 tRNA (adenosine(37)-N6)-dimethylallyltransferase MiaA [Bacteroidales bacterium]
MEEPNSKAKKYLFIVLGPTGIGKTDLTIHLAKHFKTSIISCDSRQFYKELKIGVAAPDNDQLARVTHHFIGNISIHDYYNVSRFENDVLEKLDSLFQHVDIVFMTGGSGLYIDAVCNGIDDLPDIDEEIRNNLIHKAETEGVESLRFELKRLDPEFYNIVDLKNKNRILRALEVCITTGKPYSALRTNQHKKREFEVVKIGLNMERKMLYERIDRRVDIMLESGLIDEAKSFYSFRTLNALNTVGYKELFEHFDGNYSLDEAIRLIKRNSRHYAKRQLSWFGRYNDITWFLPSQECEIISFIKQKM